MNTKSLVFITLLLSSLVVKAEIVDMNDVTFDTETGFYWLDLTFTLDRSFDEVTAELGAGGEFEGWMYASVGRAITLWDHMGLSTPSIVPISTTDPEYQTFINAAQLLGNPYFVGKPIDYDYGAIGITKHLIGIGMSHRRGLTETRTKLSTGNPWLSDFSAPYVGSYLITTSLPSEFVSPTPVPLPASIWLFASGLIGLAGFARSKKV